MKLQSIISCVAVGLVMSDCAGYVGAPSWLRLAILAGWPFVAWRLLKAEWADAKTTS